VLIWKGVCFADGKRNSLPTFGSLMETIDAAYEKDPALRGSWGRLHALLYPGVQAILAHKASHALWRIGVPLLPVAISQLARAFTGVEIHPGARIGRRFFIDHGTGVVIGETAEIGNDVMMYHGVTLGGRGFWRDEKGRKRHPTIEDGVVLGVGATVIGPVNIGRNSKIGAMSLVLHDVPEGSVVRAAEATVVRQSKV
jgi:serine O-acetyltransferase